MKTGIELTAFSISADKEAEELLADLKRAKEELEQAEWELGKGGSFMANATAHE